MLYNRCAVVSEQHELPCLQRRRIVYRSYVRSCNYRCYWSDRLAGIRYIRIKSVVQHRTVQPFIYLKSSLSTKFQELCIYRIS